MREIKIKKSNIFLDETYNTNLQIDSGNNAFNDFVIMRIISNSTCSQIEFGFDNVEDIDKVIKSLQEHKRVFRK